MIEVKTIYEKYYLSAEKATAISAKFYERLPFLSQVSVTVLVRLFAGFELTYCIAVAVAFPLFPDLDADLSEIFQAEE